MFSMKTTATIHELKVSETETTFLMFQLDFNTISLYSPLFLFVSVKGNGHDFTEIYIDSLLLK